MAFVDKHGRSVFQSRPRKDSLDDECNDLILIAKTARRNGDSETLQKVRHLGDDFFQRHPEYKACCWGAAFEESYT